MRISAGQRLLALVFGGKQDGQGGSNQPVPEPSTYRPMTDEEARRDEQLRRWEDADVEQQIAQRENRRQTAEAEIADARAERIESQKGDSE